jgi:DNA repair protein RecO (recombination protein O)
MPLFKTEALVLAARPLGDTEKIVTLLTPKLGVIHAVAKGARRPKSRLAGGTVAYRVIEALVYRKEGRELDYLSEAHVLSSASRIGSDWRLFLHAGTLAEVALAAGEDCYQLLRTALELLEGGLDPRPVTLFFFKGLMRAQGLWPDFSRCAACEDDLVGGAAVDVAGGRVFCRRHRREGGLPLNAGGVRLLEGIERRAVLKGRHAADVLKDALKVSLSLVEYHFDIRLRSTELLPGAESLLGRTTEAQR